MSLKHVQSWPGVEALRASRQDQTGAFSNFRGHSHFWARALSRRRFLGTAAGLAAAGAIGSTASWGQLGTGSALAQPGTGIPKPIPGGSPAIEAAFGQLFHVFVPGVFDPDDAEPSSIGDFNGHIGMASIHGMGTRTNLATSQTERLPFDTDMRFMKGAFVGTDDRVHRGTFAFI